MFLLRLSGPKMLAEKVMEMLLPNRYFTRPLVSAHKKMNAVVFQKNGPPSVMKIDHIDRPEPSSGQVLLKVFAVGVNPIDVKLRKHPISSYVRPLPKIPGTDVAGVILKCSPNSNYIEGQKVFAMMPLLFWKFGASAEYACVPESLVAAMPEGMSMTDAAALPLVSLTVVEGFDKVLAAMGGDMTALRGSRILVTAGSGGVGSMAVQYAKHVLGAAVVATTCRGSKAERVRALGADVVVDYTDPLAAPLEEVVRDFDVVFDTLAYVYMDRVLAPHSRMLRRDGRGHYVHVGGSRVSLNPGDEGTDALGMSVPEARLDKLARHFLQQAWSSLGWSTRPRYHAMFVRPSGAILSRVKDYCEQGKLRAVVGSVLPGGLKDVGAAHDTVESGYEGVGKVVVSIAREE